jgi:peptidoglycan hydrolase-like protein with peptidoglycan-binding domain
VTVQVAGFVSRAEAGLVPPRSVSHDVSPSRGGLAVHYGGSPARVKNHSSCAGVWRAYQDWHMRPGGLGVPQGGNDIAYNWGICPHGYIFAGRGLGVRPGANGTSQANTTHYAVCWMNDRVIPNDEVMDAVEWTIDTVRSHGAGMSVVGHRGLYQTTCPGNAMALKVKKYDGRPIDGKTPHRPPKPSKAPPFPLKDNQYFGRGSIVHRSGLSIYQGQMHARGWDIDVDGVWGPQTEKVTRQFQKEKGLTVDGKVGPKTWAEAWTAPVT